MSRPMKKQEAMDVVYKLMKDPRRTANEVIALSMGMQALDDIGLVTVGTTALFEENHMGKVTVFYELYVHFTNSNDNLIYIGTDREYAQDLVDDLEKAEEDEKMRPMDYTLKEIITIGGTVISCEPIDI